MSLSWKEIDAVLNELSLSGCHIQQIIQADFANLYLHLYCSGSRSVVRVCLETGKTRLHGTDNSPRKPKVRQRFDQFLHSRIKGGKIVSVRQVNADRIVRIDVERGGQATLLWIRLWGGAANLIVTDSDGTILDANYRRPNRGEVTGAHYFVEDDPELVAESQQKLASFENRFASAQDVSADIALHYESRDLSGELSTLRQQVGHHKIAKQLASICVLGVGLADTTLV